MRAGDYHLAYVFERFPTFTQTFCVREVLELERQGLRPLIFSIRDTREESMRHFPEELVKRVHYLPQDKELVKAVESMKGSGELPQSVVLTLRHWGEDRPDKRRVYEAAYIGKVMKDHELKHAHTHFAGIGARACWWIKKFWGGTFSFTGHANDIFRDDSGSEVTLERLMGAASFVATVSEFTARELRLEYADAKRKVMRVYNGLDLERFRVARDARRAAANNAGDESKRILSVGRLIEKKGFSDLIRACRKLRDRGLENLSCEIVGDGPLEEELWAEIQALDLEDTVKLVGPKKESEVVSILGRTDLFVLPCVTEREGGKDNLPTVIMEAMASAVPCVSTRLAGVPEMVDHGATGLLVEERDVEGLSEAMENLLQDREKAEVMGLAGYALAKERFSLEKTAGVLLRLLVARGCVRFDFRLTATKGVSSCYLRQWWKMGFGRVFSTEGKVAYLRDGRAVGEKELRGG